SIGGTNCIQALVSVTDSQTVNLINPQTKSFGLIDNLDSLTNIILGILDPTYPHVVLNFAYPIRPFLTDNGLLVGVLTHSTKEHQFIGLINYPVGETLSKVFEEKLQKKFYIMCANDVVNLTLAAHNNETNYQELISMVLGTGNNFGMFLDASNVVNLESGNFSDFEQTNSGKFIDEQSNDPGLQKFEKEVSGRYLYL